MSFMHSLGVVKMTNKLNGAPFDGSDEEVFQVGLCKGNCSHIIIVYSHMTNRARALNVIANGTNYGSCAPGGASVLAYTTLSTPRCMQCSAG